MKKVSFLILLLFLMTTYYGIAQVKYFVVFCAKGGVPGHAFVSFGKEDNNKQASITDGSWGLYPKSSYEGASSPVIGEVPGNIANDFLTKIDLRLIKEVDFNTYNKALSLKKDWSSKNYKLLESDCLSFLIAVANTVSGLKLPERSGLANLPVQYLQKLLEMNKEGDFFTDVRDGRKYKIVKIGTQTWMAENLNYNTSNSWCNQCETYGRLYTYDAAKGACPSGWHLPSDTEWTTLINYLGGEEVAGGKMKATKLWNSPNDGATNSSGFTAFPGGGASTNGYFNGLGDNVSFWSTTEDYNNVWCRSLGSCCNFTYRFTTAKGEGASVRCMKD